MVRLVEALLNNAATPSPSSPPPPPNGDAHPSDAGMDGNGGGGGGGGDNGGRSGGGGGGGADDGGRGDGRGSGRGGGRGGGGLERQAAFIEVWVRHLLSRRWHLRDKDVSRRVRRRCDCAADLRPSWWRCVSTSRWHVDVYTCIYEAVCARDI